MNRQKAFRPILSLPTKRERPWVMGWVSPALSGDAIGVHVRVIQMMAVEFEWRWTQTVHATSNDVDSRIARFRRFVALNAPDGVIVPDPHTLDGSFERLTDITSVVTVWPGPQIHPFRGGTVTPSSPAACMTNESPGETARHSARTLSVRGLP